MLWIRPSSFTLYLFSFALFSSAHATLPLSFHQALNEMQSRNLEIQTQQEKVKKMHWALFAQWSNFFPKFSIQTSEQQLIRNHFTKTQQAYLNGQINLFRFGADWVGLQSARAGLAKEEQNLRQLELDSEQSNVQLLLGYIEAALYLQVAEKNQGLSSELSEIEGLRYEKGLIPLQEAQRALIEKNNSLAKFADSQSLYQEKWSYLKIQLGQHSVEKLWPWQSLLSTLEIETIKDKLLTRELIPEWKAQQLNLQIEDLTVNSKFRLFFPSLDLSFSYGYPDLNYPQDTHTESLLTFSVPLFDISQLAEYQIARKQKLMTQFEIEKFERRIEREWELVKANLTRALDSARERQKSLQMAQALYQDNLRRLRAGRSNLNDIVVDQNRLAEAEILAINGWAKAHLLYASFCHLRGEKLNEESPNCL